MAKAKKYIGLRIAIFILLLIVGGAAIFAFWLSHHYKQVISEKLPQIVTNGSDSIYHISYRDINVSLVNHDVTITDIQLTPDTKQAAMLRQAHRHIPPTLHTISIPLLEAYGIKWKDLISNHSLECEKVIIHDIRWQLACTPRPQDSLFARDPQHKPFINRISSHEVSFVNPHITYHFRGLTDTFYAFLKGGTGSLTDWAYNYDEKKDTSVFLFAKSGKLRLDSFIFLKRSGRYTTHKPILDFECSGNSVTLKNAVANNMTNRDPNSGVVKEIYNLRFPSTELIDFNWNKLINHNTLAATTINATGPALRINYIRENAAGHGRKGAFPSQLLLQIGMQIHFNTVNIKEGLFSYTETTPKGSEGVIEFTGLHGQFHNVTNIDSVIAHNKNCMVKLSGRYHGKSDITATFNFALSDTSGKFKVDGSLQNLDGKDVSEQAAVFTLVKVTSFHLNHMDIHIEGDESYSKGTFTVRYQDLKISLLKFDTKMREGKKGMFAFLGSALVLYPSNPMPGKDVRSVTTSFARDTTKGFFNILWQHIFRAAKKTAVREQSVITLTDGPETQKGETPKKGFLKRLFGKHKK